MRTVYISLTLYYYLWHCMKPDSWPRCPTVLIVKPLLVSAERVNKVREMSKDNEVAVRTSGIPFGPVEQ
jgi:hypothetical protein